MSLADRVVDGRKTFSAMHINRTLLREVYRRAGIRKKKYSWYKQPPVIDERARAFQLRSMKRLLTMARRDGCRIIYIDETHFTRNTLPESEWTLPKQNVTLDLVLKREPTLSLLHGVSKDGGNEHYCIYKDSINTKKFKKYLDELAASLPGVKLCLFMDNLAVHSSEKSKRHMRELGIKYIYNLTYAPDYNPIELVFSKVKQKFKTLRAQKLAGLIQDGHESLIRKAVKNVRKKDIRNCIEHVERLLA